MELTPDQIREICRLEIDLCLQDIITEMEVRFGARSLFRKDHTLKIGSFYDLIKRVRERL